MAATKPRPSLWRQALLGGALLVLMALGLNFSAARPTLLAAMAHDAFLTRRAAPAADPATGIDLDSPAALNGLMTKHGPSAMVTGVRGALAAGQNATLALAYPLTWREPRLAGAHTPPPFKWCAVMFNDKYRLIYIKCAKTAGTPLIFYFGQCVPGAADNLDSCLTMIDVDDAAQVQHLIDAWPHYFVFGFSRNILARAISQYKYLTHFMADCPLVTWDEFCADPLVLGDACYRAARDGAPCCPAMVPGKEPAVHQYVHATPQTHCFTTADGRSAVDWLGRMELFDADFAGLIDLLNSRPGVPQLPQRKPGRINYSESPCQGGRRLQQGWQVREGTLNPCDPLDYFRGPRAHCLPDLLSFFREDIEFGLRPQMP